MARPSRPKIGLASVRCTVFNPEMEPEFSGRMRAHVARLAEIPGREFGLVETPLIESEADAEVVGSRLAGERLDAIVFAPAMPTPPSYASMAVGRATATSVPGKVGRCRS